MNYKVGRRFKTGSQAEDDRFEPFYSVNIARVVNSHTEMATRELAKQLRDGGVTREQFFAGMAELGAITESVIKELRPGNSVAVLIGPFRYFVEAIDKDNEFAQPAQDRRVVLALIAGMEAGKKYRIQYKEPSHRFVRQAVMVHLGLDERVVAMSARPIGGTQSLPMDWIQRIEEVEQTVPVFINKVLRPAP